MRASTSSARACSGDMYATVPIARPGVVKNSDVKAVASAVLPANSASCFGCTTCLARPKSRILPWLRSVIKIFTGLISR